MIKASVSRNKREGRYVGYGTFCGALKIRRVGYVFFEVAGKKHHRVHVGEPRPVIVFPMSGRVSTRGEEAL